MRIVKAIGTIMLIAWMGWITVRMEMVLRIADDACRQLNPPNENPDRCASGVFYLGLVDRIHASDANSKSQ